MSASHRIALAALVSTGLSGLAVTLVFTGHLNFASASPAPRDRDDVALLKSDLKRLRNQQRGYHQRNGTFTVDFLQLDEFTFSPGVRLINGFAASPHGWSIEIKNMITGATCTFTEDVTAMSGGRSIEPTCTLATIQDASS
ncbi:MAG: hypothetical protein M3081_02150 [Gemmatimonadota bacterium]|nr:hypothetical protein [Gemmatimonadota bacterium]